MLRCDAPWFEQFGEIYFSAVHPGAIKGCHLHQRITLNYAVVTGMVKPVMYDDRENSNTRGELMEIFTGEDSYALITIPSGIWNGLKGIGAQPAIVANYATEPHDPEEIIRLDPFSDSIPYDWSLKHG